MAIVHATDFPLDYFAVSSIGFDTRSGGSGGMVIENG